MNKPAIYHPVFRWQIVLACLVLAGASLACAMVAPSAPPPAAPTADPGFLQTAAALDTHATVLAAKEATLSAPTMTPTPLPPTETPLPSATPLPADTPVPVPPTSIPVTETPQTEPSVDMETRMQEAKILVFEDTQPIGYWIKQSLDSTGYKYTHVGDAVGTFLEYLNSGIEWDLVIVGAEAKSGVRGEFWDALTDQVNRKVGLIAEIWYLDTTVNGRIKPLLTDCGLDFQRDLKLADSIYWLEPMHPVFNDPNTVMPLLHYSRYWGSQAGDLISVRPGSDAVLLAGTQKTRPTDYGQIAACMEGRVIFQTFSNHDYPRADILQLWQNYVDYTLRNHFEALDAEE